MPKFQKQAKVAEKGKPPMKPMHPAEHKKMMGKSSEAAREKRLKDTPI